MFRGLLHAIAGESWRDEVMSMMAGCVTRGAALKRGAATGERSSAATYRCAAGAGLLP